MSGFRCDKDAKRCQVTTTLLAVQINERLDPCTANGETWGTLHIMKIELDSIIELLHREPAASLATQSVQMPGYPYASTAPFVPDENHRPVFLLSRLAEHTKNLLADPRASLLVAGVTAQNVLANARLTLAGNVERIDASPELIQRYVRYQPDAEQYLSLGDFEFFRMLPLRGRYVGGFGRMGWIEQEAWEGFASLSFQTESRLLAQLAGGCPSGMQLLGLDLYGIDLHLNGKRRRIRFPEAPVAEAALDEVFKCAITQYRD